LSQAGNLNADRFLNRRWIERAVLDQRQQQGGCQSLATHSEFTQAFSGFRAAFDKLVRALVLGKFASKQHPGAF
jgi:hypothetical protein